MVENRNCPSCGSIIRYSRARNANICEQCGHVLVSEQEREELMRYDRDVALAKEHLMVGNWDECNRIIKPLCTRYPSDKQLYLLLLAAVTRGYEDFLFGDYNRRREAKEYWDKLSRLNCVNRTMKEYAKRRINREEEMRDRQHTVVATVLLICAIISLLIFLVNNWFLNVLLVIGWIMLIRWGIEEYSTMKVLHPKKSSMQNPFL